MEYYIDAFRNYVNFKGRATRKQYWMFVLFNCIAVIALWLIACVVPALAFLVSIYNLGVLLPGLAIGARRLHDTDRSAWWLLLNLLPIVGPIVLLVFSVLPSTPGSNRFDFC